MQFNDEPPFSFGTMPADPLLTLSLSGIAKGTLFYYVETRLFQLDSVVCGLFGTAQAHQISLQELSAFVLERDRQSFLDRFNGYSSSATEQGLAFQVRSKHRAKKNILLAGSPFTRSENKSTLIVFTAIELPHFEQPSGELQDSAVDKLIENDPDVITRWDRDLKLIFANPAFAQKAGMPLTDLTGKDNLEMGQPVQIAVPYMRSLQKVFDSGLPGEHYNAFPTHSKQLYYHSRLTPEFGADGTIRSVLAVARDITELREQQLMLAQSERRFRSLISQAPIATCLFVGKKMIIEVANDLMIGYWGKDRSVIGMPLLEAVPELEGQPFIDILSKVFETGITYEDSAAPAQLKVNGTLSTYYFNFTYKPLFDETGKVYGIMDMALDVTSETLSLMALAASEQKVRSIISSAPVAMGIFMGNDLIIDLPNQAFINVIGKGPKIEGRRLAELLPELENQGFISLLQKVYQTGEPYYGYASPLDLSRHGQLQRSYYDISFTPIRDLAGQIYAVLDISVDVTQAVLAKQRIDAAETQLLNVIEMAEIATWKVDLVTGIVSCSDRFKQWYGLSDYQGEITFELIGGLMHPGHFDYFREMLNFLGSENIYAPYSAEYKIHSRDGSTRILRDQGQVSFSPDKRAVMITGSVQDITLQIIDRENLKQEIVESSTHLRSSRLDLERSNSNLLQFAYVASHDLQEPLRKIRTFSNLLKTQYGDQIGSGAAHLQRIEDAAQRMTVLIQDLLDFSQISTEQQTQQTVSLDQVMAQILDDLELRISENRARLNIRDLPELKGNPTQLYQLFLNLINNAIKFQRPGNTPVIAIEYSRLTLSQLPAEVQPSRMAEYYYRIDVSDNGIGFDQQFADRIFQVFQRLHNRTEFKGTGIGLAICEKVAANHGGAIGVRSIPGTGSVFSVYLPI